MKPRFDILGKSHYALAIILDCLQLLHPEGCEVLIVSNIDEAQNDSALHAFEVPGIMYRTIPSSAYRPDPAVPKILGSIGKSRRAIVRHFEEIHGLPRDQYVSLEHPAATIGTQVTIGHGVHIGPGSTIAPFCEIGDFCVINRHVSIGHHTRMDAFSCLNPGVTLSGVCHLGEDVVVGAGAVVIDQITIGERSIVGAGSVVTRSIPAGVVAYGSPAKVIREI